MTKIMLVEDDNNLREIYEARLLAEGYEIVSAEDGGQALAMAVKEKPDLIISDVMMPKISGFDMLDILRSTPETRDTKVIMMTALSQAEDKARADKLGADRYLVKSQVTLEDVTKVAREVLQDDGPKPPASDSTEPSAPPSEPPATPPQPDSTTKPEPSSGDDQSGSPTNDTATAAAVANEPVAVATPPTTSDDPAPVDNATVVAPTPVAEPPQPAADSGSAAAAVPGAQTTAEESADIEKQIKDFAQNIPTEDTAATPAMPVADPAQAAPAAPDATNAASDTAANMANAVNDLLQKSDDNAAKTADGPKPAVSNSGNHIAGKKVISPINDLSGPKPDLNALLAKEMGTPAPSAAEPAVPPAASSPAPATIDPSNSDKPVEIKTPGNVLSPDDPNSVAL